MNATASDLIALPARINAAGCKAVRDSLTFPEGYGNYYSRDTPHSANLNELMENHADAGNHALIRDLMKTSLPVDTIAQAINRFWFTEDYNAIIHNILLIIDQMHRDGFLIDMNVLPNAVAALTYPSKTRIAHRILTHSKLDQAVAIIRFITAVGLKDSNVKTRQTKVGSYAVANPYLESYIRENLDRTDEIIALMKGRRILRTKQGLTPVLLALHNEHIKTLTAEAPDLTDKMFDYYYERNPGTGTNDIAPLLEYLGTANALTSGYL